MPFADKRNQGRKVTRQEHPRLSVPMGDQRFQQLMSELSAAFAQAYDGQERRRHAQESDRKRALWLAERDAVIVEIVSTMHQLGLKIDDLA